MGLIQPIFARGVFVFAGYVNPFLTTWEFNATENMSECPMIVGGTIRHLRVRLATAPSGSRTFTFRKNGSNQAVTVTISGTDVEATDTTHSFGFSAGDIITLQQSASGAANSASMSATFEVEHADTVTSVFGFGGASTSFSNTTAVYDSLFTSGRAITNTDGRTYNVIAVTGTITGWRGELSAAPGSGKSRTWVIEKNGVVQDGTSGTPDTRLTFADSDTQQSAAFTLPVSPLDLVRFVTTPSGTPATANCNGTVQFVAATPGQLMWCGSPQTAATDGTYQHVVCGAGSGFEQLAWNATEANREQLGPVTTIELSGLYVSMVAEPGAGASYTFTLRKNQESTAQAVTVADTDTEGGPSGGAIVELGAGDRFSMLGNRSGFPNTPPRWAFLMTDPNVPTGGNGFNALLVSP